VTPLLNYQPAKGSCGHQWIGLGSGGNGVVTLSSIWHSHGNDFITVPAVDFEISVESNYLCRTVDLGKPDKASVGQ
jgi:hypothetical protein